MLKLSAILPKVMDLDILVYYFHLLDRNDYICKSQVYHLNHHENLEVQESFLDHIDPNIPEVRNKDDEAPRNQDAYEMVEIFYFLRFLSIYHKQVKLKKKSHEILWE